MKQLIFLSLFLFSSMVHAEQFQAPLTNTQWQVVESPIECILSQPIDGFGEAKFMRRSGENFSLVFTTKSHPATQSNAHFEIAQAPWQNSEERLPLMSIPTDKNQMEFVLNGDLAKQALTHIQEGQFPTLRYTSHSASEEINVLFSTVHLTDSMPAFQQCLENLHPDTFEDIRKLTVYFGLEQAKLSDNAQASLTRIADYIKVDDSIKQVAINAYTDNHGRKRLNIELSEARAIAIKNFFVQQAELPESLITTAFHREFNPSKSNKTKLGRAHNRRAEIEVFK